MPFIKSKNTTTKMMMNVIIALIPIMLFSIYKNGYIPYKNDLITFGQMFYPLLIVLIATLSTFFFETLYQVLFNKEKKLKEIIGSSYAFMPGIFLGMILPINTPISIVILGGFVSSIIAKMLFGGFGNNIFNPALVGRLFIISCYAMVITNNGGYLNKYELDTISSATPLSNASIVADVSSYEALVEPYGSLLDFFVGTIPGTIGETSALLCLVAFIYLALTKTIKWIIPVLYISTVFVMSLIIGGSLWFALFSILSGGLMFGAVFMATDPVTSPVTKRGQILFGLMLGLLTVTFRHLTPYPEGVLTSILTMNMLVFILDKLGLKDKKAGLISLAVILALILTMSFVIKENYNKEEGKDPNYEILNVKTEGNKVIYQASQKGYSSNLICNITFEGGKVTKMELVSQNDSFYSKIENEKYLDRLVKEQDKKEEIDTISGATISSNALKTLLLNTIEDYENGGYKSFTGGTEVEVQKDFEVLSIEGNVYKVKNKSFGGSMILEVTVEDGKVTDMNLLEYKDTCISKEKTNHYYECPMYLEEGYIDDLIKNNEIDTVSGATISSSSLKDTIKKVLEVYNEG
jgi:electron transport complex protein RnfD